MTTYSVFSRSCFVSWHRVEARALAAAAKCDGDVLRFTCEDSQGEPYAFFACGMRYDSCADAHRRREHVANARDLLRADYDVE